MGADAGRAREAHCRAAGLLGWTFDLSLEPTSEASAVEGGELAGGTTGSTPMGYVGPLDPPDEAGYVDRNNGWGDEGNRLGFGKPKQ